MVVGFLGDLHTGIIFCGLSNHTIRRIVPRQRAGRCPAVKQNSCKSDGGGTKRHRGQAGTAARLLPVGMGGRERSTVRRGKRIVDKRTTPSQTKIVSYAYDDWNPVVIWERSSFASAPVLKQTYLWGVSVPGDLSLAKQTFSENVEAQSCPSTVEVCGARRVRVIAFDLGLHTALGGPVFAKAGSKFKITGSVSLTGNISGWSDVTHVHGGVKVALLSRADFDLNSTASASAQVVRRGAVLYNGSLPSFNWSGFGDKRPYTGEQ